MNGGYISRILKAYFAFKEKADLEQNQILFPTTEFFYSYINAFCNDIAMF